MAEYDRDGDSHEDEDEAGPALHAPGSDPWVLYCQVALVFCGACYVAAGYFMPAILEALEPSSSGPTELDWIIDAASLVLLGGFGLVNFAVAWGLARRARWAWIGALVIGGLYAPSGCLPFGAILLYGMLNQRTRAQFSG